MPALPKSQGWAQAKCEVEKSIGPYQKLTFKIIIKCGCFHIGEKNEKDHFPNTWLATDKLRPRSVNHIPDQEGQADMTGAAR